MTEKMFNQKTGYGLAALSGILLLLSFPPFKFGGFLAWFALVPLLIAIYHEKSLKRIGIFAIISCIILFVPVLFGVIQSESMFFLPSSLFLISWLIAIILSVGLCLIYSEFFRVYWKPKEFSTIKLQYLPSSLQIFILPLVWTAFQFLIMNIPIIMKFGGGLGFFSIAKTQWLNPSILQIASFTGMYGVTFLILLVNCAIAYAIVHYKETKHISKQAVAVLLVFGLIFIAGWSSIPEPILGDITIAIIQAPPSENVEDIYINLSKQALKYNPKMILWSSVSMKEALEAFSTDLSKELNVNLMDGKLISPDGRIQKRKNEFAYLYLKTLDGLIPPNLSKIFPEIYPYETEFGKIGFLLCQEGAWPFPARKMVKNGADIITTATVNYGFAVAGLFESNAIYRAVENRVPAILFLWSGAGSIIVDPYGRIIEDIAPEKEIVAGKISLTKERTFYNKYGNIFGWIIILLFISLVIYNFYLKRKSPVKYCVHCNAKLKKDVKTCTKCGKKADWGKLRKLVELFPP